jgi:replicative DNA helicase
MKNIPIKTNSEEAALSLMVQDQDILKNQSWHSDYFATPVHKAIFEAIQGFHQRNGACDEFNAITELESRGQMEFIGGQENLNRILSVLTIPPSKVCQDMADDYRKELHEAKTYRDLIKEWEEQEDDLRRGRGDLPRLSATINSVGKGNQRPKRTKKDMLNRIIDEIEGKVQEEFYPTGLIMLDRTLKGGLHKGEMMTVAAETGGGKSILLVQSALASVLEGKSVLFFSLEMSGEDIYRRMAANLAGVPIREMDDYKTQYGRELPLIAQSITKLLDLPIEVIDFVSDINDIETEIARYANEGRAEVIAVDYIQIVNMPKVENRENAISEIARRLKTAAMKHKSVMLTASQLNDDGRLRESRAIGMHSDQVVCINHKGDKSSLVVKKNRRGPRNYTISVTMNGELSKFEEVW